MRDIVVPTVRMLAELVRISGRTAATNEIVAEMEWS